MTECLTDSPNSKVNCAEVDARRCKTAIATLTFACALALGSNPALSAPAPGVADAERIAEARDIVKHVGDSLWPQWSKTPFVIDLLTPQYETLLNTSSIPKGFAKPFRRAPFRKRTFPTSLEATFPAFGADPVIVIGVQQLTAAKTPAHWIVTLLHEHFHQWQYSWHPYRDDVDALDLANGDKTGMWMLDYAFPYGSPRIAHEFNTLSARLGAAVMAVGTARFSAVLRTYLRARSAWRASLTPKDYRYFAFQSWQEGVARYTEFRIAQLAVRAHESHPAFLTASQTRQLKEDSRDTYAGTLRELNTASLAKAQRVAFYAFGAGEAILLDRVLPDWHERYLNAQMDLSVFLPQPRS